MEICRLCLLGHNQHINVFADYEPDKNVAAIISKHVSEVCETDPLPKNVCLDCWNRIVSFHEFYEKVHTRQDIYLRDLIKFEQESNFITIPEPVHVNVDAPVSELRDETSIKIEFDDCRNAPLSPNLISCDDEIDIKLQDNAFEDETEVTETHSFEHSEEENDLGSEDEKSSETPAKRKRYEYSFICDFCQQSVSSKQRLLEHLLRHVKYRCRLCSERCLTQRELELHNKTIHGKDAEEKARKQLVALEPMLTMVPSHEEIDRILTKNVDTMCDHCKKHIDPSLDEALTHYDRKHGVSGYLKCCDILLKTIDDVNNHVVTHLYPKLFNCEVCGSTGKRIDKFRKHVSRHLDDIQNFPYLCTICNKRFTRDDLLDVHMRYIHSTGLLNTNHTLADFFTMRCDLCDTQFSSLQDAKDHYKIAHKRKGYLTCCNKKFLKAKSVDNHFLWHVNPELNKCNICGKCFKQKVCFLTHLEKHKKGIQKRYQCTECDKAFSARYYMKIHMRKHDETKKKALACPHCGKRYTTPKSLENHILFIHNKEPKAGDVSHMCEYCGKRFISRSSVLTHIQNVHRSEAGLANEDPSLRSQCTMCTASFINKYRLKKHVDSVHLGKPVKCPHCDKVAPNEPALTCHLRSVHVAQSFQCHLCPKTFKAAVALKDHIATHTGEKTYKCAFCPEAFIWRPNMYSHQKKAHPEEWQNLKGKGKERKVGNKI